MQNASPTYEVLAFRLGTHADRLARENFLISGGPFDPSATMPTDYYIWLVRNDQHMLLVDTGFPEHLAARRGRTIVASPVDGLRDLGIAPADISDIVLTHMHYDHISNLDLFPTARAHLQEAELKFCTGPAMRHAAVRQPFELGNVVSVI